MADATTLDGTPTRDDRPERIRPVRLLYALGVWLGLAVLAILNAGVRETVFSPAVGDYWGHVASTATFVTVVAVVSALYFGRYTEHSLRELVVVGAAWLVMTVLFEFGFGHYVMGNSWATLFADYDLLAGRVWVLVLLSLAIAPVVFGHFLKR